ncbi:hypothetical protein F511_17850 [Dorcoceras hygrometricum]|uniref:Uncharacterized protein n=1 Tax=Dorcoceras hygrometricum TaxID=472368 RepID=A0A2Z7C8M8_9LAMI|nr:hypothetical protein F511_17850 [Dorcoceras hygrometricum]
MSSPDYDLVTRLAESIDHSWTAEASSRRDETSSPVETYRARILRIDQDEARLAAQGCTCIKREEEQDQIWRGPLARAPRTGRRPSKEKRKASPEKKERRRKRRHEERGTGSTQESIPEVTITDPEDTTNKGPEQKSTEEPYTLLDASTISFVSKPSGSASLDFIRHLVPDQDFDQLKRTPDLEVFETAGLHFMQSLVWFGEPASRFSKAHAEALKTKRSYDGMLGRHEALLKQLEEIQTKENVEKKSLSAELESARAEAQTLKTQVQSLEARAQLSEEESKLHLAEVEKLQEERANSWALEKEKFLQSKDFDRLCLKKAVMYFDKGFEGCLAQFKANGYSEEEHPTPFLDVEQALADMPDDENSEEGSSDREGAPPA